MQKPSKEPFTGLFFIVIVDVRGMVIGVQIPATIKYITPDSATIIKVVATINFLLLKDYSYTSYNTHKLLHTYYCLTKTPRSNIPLFITI